MMPEAPPLSLLLLTGLAWYMTGIIWLIQQVHYPLMAFADPARYTDFHEQHMARILPVVGPPMLAELGLSTWWAYQAYDTWGWAGFSWGYLAVLGMTLLLFASTFFIQMPQHNRLAAAWDAVLHLRLVRGNLPRSLLWTARALLLTWLLWQGAW